MPTLREVRSRISGVKKTQKITKAMKMVAAAKLRRAQAGVMSARPYANALKTLLQHLAPRAGELPDDLTTQRELRRVAVVVITADRGMCGAFNSNIIKASMAHARTAYAGLADQGKLRMFVVGRKGVDFFAKQPLPVDGKYPGVFGKLAFASAQAIAQRLVEGYRRGDFDRVDIVYNEFKSVSQQRIVVDQFLPVPPEPPRPEAQKRAASVDYIYEPSPKEILQGLVPKYLNFQLWRILLESNASEEGARMTAMENATENANEMIETLQLQYNKARQWAITKELLEIVSGAEALSQAG